ncbi:hypothetical protein DYU11_08975 [Fibrisoma montanum]|uniref:Uncharacterized protein n=1 Tax=Fibrisoma montanum TaxID=2305895 RepID=A0A418MF35_9BACT|nr:hypothetical protein [Fibrisoma montanum]RIV25420.1 hypothetical protein DYU11_08975 [Fibrisoma montanum]
MKVYLAFFWFVCIGSQTVYFNTASAQDAIYFSNGDQLLNARITNLTGDKVTFSVEGNPKEHSFSRSRILMAFTKTGHFLLMSELATDLEQAKQQLRTFLEAPLRNDSKDYLIKAIPITVIPGEITYDSDELVNYKAVSGNSASINKDELLAILYKDGRHSIIALASDVAPILAEIRPTVFNGGKPVTSTTPAPPFSVTNVTTAQADLTATTPSKPVVVEPVAAQPTDLTPSKPVVTPPPHAMFARPRLTLTEEEKEGYRQKSLARVEDFVAYINIITDKNISNDDKDRAIAQATKLFMAGATVEVTSVSRPGSRTLSIGQYLTRLKLLPYKSTRIEWVQTKFVKDLSQEADGNYYGTIAGQQTFIGYDSNGKPVYSDSTAKNVRVKLESYQKVIDGQELDKWRVLLGNVSVETEQN